MSEKEPFYRRTTFGYLSSGLLVALVSTMVFSPLRDRIFSHVTEQVSPTPTATPQPPKTDTRDKKNLHTDLNAERMREEYDSLSSRFTAVEGSLKQRSLDLGNQPMKPEITAALQTARSDLAETKDALAAGDFDRAKRRLQRIEEKLSYLESL